MARFVILTVEQCEEIRGDYVIYPQYDIKSRIQPFEMPDGNWAIPVEIIDDPDFRSIREFLLNLPMIDA